MHDTIVYDTEADGLLDEATKLHCLCALKLETKALLVLTPNGLDREAIVKAYPNHTILFGGFDHIGHVFSEGNKIVCHNQLGYDLPLLKKLAGLDYSVSPDVCNGKKLELIDTLVWSRALHPDRRLPTGTPDKVKNPVTGRSQSVTPHSLLGWTTRVNGTKPIIDDWRDQPLETYVIRCIEDVLTNALVYEALIEEQGSHDWDTALRIAKKSYHLMCEQERQGVVFDTKKASALRDQIDTMMADISAEVEPKLPPRTLSDSSVKKPPKNQFKKNGEPTAHANRYFPTIMQGKDGYWFEHPDTGVKTTLPYHEPLVTKATMTLANQKDIKEWLVSEGWKPTLWNFKKDKAGKPERDDKGGLIKTSPKMQEAGNLCRNLERMEGNLVKQVVKWLSLRNRRSVIQAMDTTKTTGWLNNPRLEIDGRLSAGSSGLTNTRRQKHRSVANVPKAKKTVLLGKEMRDLFRAPKGKVLVGYDAAGLEARNEAHYTHQYDGGEYANLILEGDIHSHNAVAFGLITQQELDLANEVKTKRDNCQEITPAEKAVYDKWDGARNGGGKYGGGAKGGKYAVTYGAQATKLAETLGMPKSKGEKIFNSFWKDNPALKSLRDDLEAEWTMNNKKWITGIDGGKIFTRSKHSLVNTLFQNCGAIVMDLAGCYMDNWVAKEKLDAKRVIYYHDEYAWECSPEHAQRAGELGSKSIKKAGEFFKMAIPLDADYEIGQTWADIH